MVFVNKLLRLFLFLAISILFIGSSVFSADAEEYDWENSENYQEMANMIESDPAQISELLNNQPNKLNDVLSKISDDSKLVEVLSSDSIQASHIDSIDEATLVKALKSNPNLLVNLGSEKLNSDKLNSILETDSSLFDDSAIVDEVESRMTDGHTLPNAGLEQDFLRSRFDSDNIEILGKNMRLTIVSRAVEGSGGGGGLRENVYCYADTCIGEDTFTSSDISSIVGVDDGWDVVKDLSDGTDSQIEVNIQLREGNFNYDEEDGTIISSTGSQISYEYASDFERASSIINSLGGGTGSFECASNNCKYDVSGFLLKPIYGEFEVLSEDIFVDLYQGNNLKLGEGAKLKIDSVRGPTTVSGDNIQEFRLSSSENDEISLEGLGELESGSITFFEDYKRLSEGSTWVDSVNGYRVRTNSYDLNICSNFETCVVNNDVVYVNENILGMRLTQTRELSNEFHYSLTTLEDSSLEGIEINRELEGNAKVKFSRFPESYGDPPIVSFGPNLEDNEVIGNFMADFYTDFSIHSQIIEEFDDGAREVVNLVYEPMDRENNLEGFVRENGGMFSRVQIPVAGSSNPIGEEVVGTIEVPLPPGPRPLPPRTETQTVTEEVSSFSITTDTVTNSLGTSYRDTIVEVNGKKYARVNFDEIYEIDDIGRIRTDRPVDSIPVTDGDQVTIREYRDEEHRLQFRGGMIRRQDFVVGEGSLQASDEEGFLDWSKYNGGRQVALEEEVETVEREVTVQIPAMASQVTETTGDTTTTTVINTPTLITGVTTTYNPSSRSVPNDMVGNLDDEPMVSISGHNYVQTTWNGHEVYIYSSGGKNYVYERGDDGAIGRALYPDSSGNMKFLRKNSNGQYELTDEDVDVVASSVAGSRPETN